MLDTGVGEMLAACPGCIEGSSPRLQAGYLWGLATLIAAPVFLLVVVGGGLVREYRRAMRREVERLLAELAGPAAAKGREAA